MAQTNVLGDFFYRSRDFFERHKRPVSKLNSLESLVYTKQISEDDAQKYIQTNRILVHPTAKQIAKLFLDHKRTFGNQIEKDVYSAIDWDLHQFIKRLLKKRPLSFYGAQDVTYLRNGNFLSSASDKWDRVGTDNESSTIRMEDYLSYDEMMISSLLGVSGYTAYLNNGSRDNHGHLDLHNAQKDGIQIGLVGARFERKLQMDSMYLHNRLDYSKAFLGSLFPGKTFEQRYKARMRITIETMLIEAETRGAAVKMGTWLNVVGLGLGVWQIDSDQARWYIEEFAYALKSLKFCNINVLEFAWINVDPVTKELVEKAADLSAIKVIWTKRPPTERLKDSSVLLVTTYAWDSNSYPGNEFYMGALDASGDPAAAAGSLISETQNPEINVEMLQNITFLEKP